MKKLVIVEPDGTIKLPPEALKGLGNIVAFYDTDDQITIKTPQVGDDFSQLDR